MKTILIHNRSENRRGADIAAIICSAVLLAAAVIMLLPVRGEGNIYNDVVRLHVLANSDSEEDQTLKLAVRDAILYDITAVTEGAEDSDAAEVVLRSRLDEIREKAQAFVRSRGYDYSVRVTISEENYPTREYGDGTDAFRLPAGRYKSLRVVIGEGKGKNWWCVLFPPLCMSGAQIEEELAVAGYSGEQIRMFRTDSGVKYEIRFKLLEWFEELAEKLSR